MMIRDGARVAYIGQERDGLGIGDEGVVFKGEATYSHVKWTSGQHTAEIEMVRNDDLVVDGSLANHPLTADFDSPLVQINVQATYQRRGGLGLLQALHQDGHLSSFSQIAEEALALVASRLREDPSLIEVLARLDDEEGDDFIATATMVVLKDCFEEAV
jgi:hypothetical protein